MGATNQQAAAARQQQAAADLQQAAQNLQGTQKEFYRLNIPEVVEVDMTEPKHATHGYITHAPVPQVRPVLPVFGPVTIEQLLKLSDEDFGKLIDRVDPVRLKYLLDHDDDEDDGF